MLHALLIWVFISEWQLSVNAKQPETIKQRLNASLVDLTTIKSKSLQNNTNPEKERQAEAKRQKEEARRQAHDKRQE